MRIAFFTPYPEEGPSARFRVYQYLPLLRKSGIGGDVFPFLESREYDYIFLQGKKKITPIYYLRGLARRRKHLSQIDSYDLIFVHLNICPLGMYFEHLVMKKNKLTVFDFDDADFLKHESAINHWSTLLKNPAKTVKLIQQSHLVISGNSYLADFAQKHNDNVHILPTSLDTEKYLPKENRINYESVVIGWMGSAASSPYLSILDGVFRELLQKYKNIKIIVIGSKNYEAPDSRMLLKPWSLESELSDLQKIDIGLMPLTDDEYAKGKCGFKALQYMSVGTPAVVSPVGVNVEIIKDGINGFSARDTQEWVGKIGALIENAELRKKMGQAARKTVENSYSIRVNAAKLISLLEKLKAENVRH